MLLQSTFFIVHRYINILDESNCAKSSLFRTDMLYLFPMSVIKAVEESFKKPHVVDVKSGDVVRVHQKIKEGNKERVQVFEGLVIRTKRKGSLSANITVRRIASGIGVEKTFLIHSPLITKIQVVKRSKVRRNYLSYMRERTGKAARLSAVEFDQDKVNYIPEPEVKEEPKAKPTEDSEKTEEAPKSSEKAEAETAKDAKSEETAADSSKEKDTTETNKKPENSKEESSDKN